MKKTIHYYSKHATRLASQYDDLHFEQVHKSWVPLLSGKEGLALDIGAGSGRDAAALVTHGFEVFAVEPADGLRQQGKTNHPKINWLDDSLPALKMPEKLGLKFDLILLSAVWMHLKTKADRQRAFRKITDLLKPNGLLVITLRHGPSPDEREMYPVSRQEVEQYARDQALQLALHDDSASDLLSRQDTRWETLVFKYPDNGAGSLPLLRHVIINDAKSSTYKLALLRTILRIADGTQGMVLDRTPDSVTLPLGLVALVWIKQFLRLIGSGDQHFPQTSDRNKGLGFVKQGFKALQGVPPHLLNIGSHLTGDAAIALTLAINDTKRTILEMPANYITDPHSGGTVFGGAKQQVRPTSRCVIDKAYLTSFGTFYVPPKLWDAMSRYAYWIEPAILKEWYTLMKAFDKRYDNSRNMEDYYEALYYQDVKRDTAQARERAILLQGKGKPLYCVWTGKRLKEGFDIDHCFPFSYWPNNDFWNLFPCHSQANTKKSDRMPSAELLLDARDRIWEWWDQAFRDSFYVHQFESQARSSLPMANDEALLDNQAIFNAMQTQRVKLKDFQQIREWQGTSR